MTVDTDGELRVRLALMIGALARDPLLIRLTRESAASHDRRSGVTQPWQAMAEQRAAAQLCCLAALGEPGFRLIAPPLDDPLQAGFDVASDILTASVYLWSDAMMSLAFAAPLPKHVISSDLLAQPRMFWSLENSWMDDTGARETNWRFVSGPTDREGAVVTSASGPLQDLIMDIADLQNARTHEAGVVVQALRGGWVYPDDIPVEHRHHVTRLLQAVAFLSSPYVESAQRTMSRVQRRQFARDGLGAD